MADMPKMVSVKRSPKQKSPEISYKPDPYPYGLRLELDHETLEKLGVDVEDLSVGDEVCVYAMATVTSVSSREDARSGENNSASLQIEEMCVDCGDDEEDDEPPSRYQRMNSRRSK